ncbi:MAG: CsbD family protein [Rhodanobacter sp.]
MNQDMITDQWKQLTGNIKQHWGKLTDDDLKVSQGSAEYLAGRVEHRYGVAHDVAEKQVREFERELSMKKKDDTRH